MARQFIFQLVSPEGGEETHAPRLLALDEAFAGGDDTRRGELMGLAAQFGLDLFMTGYDLWATQGSIRAAAHYDLAHRPSSTRSARCCWSGTARS